MESHRVEQRSRNARESIGIKDCLCIYLDTIHIFCSENICPYSSQEMFSVHTEKQLRFGTGKPAAIAKWHVMRGVIACVCERERQAGSCGAWGQRDRSPSPSSSFPPLSPSCSVPIPLVSLSSCPPSVASAARPLRQEAWLKAQSVGHLCAGAAGQG